MVKSQTAYFTYAMNIVFYKRIISIQYITIFSIQARIHLYTIYDISDWVAQLNQLQMISIPAASNLSLNKLYS